MNLNLKYILTGVGWAECEISDESNSITISASYISDALKSLILAANTLMSGFKAVTFSFDEEPGEYRWVISSEQLNRINLKIIRFEELWGGQPDKEGKVIFETKCLPIVFAEAVLISAQNVFESYGLEGYREKWSEHEFPFNQFNELKIQIKNA